MLINWSINYPYLLGFSAQYTIIDDTENMDYGFGSEDINENN